MTEPVTLSIEQAVELGRRLLVTQGVPDDIATDVAVHVVESDRVGYPSHGLSILPNYHRVLRQGLLVPDARPVLAKDGGPLLAYDGRHGYGQHAGKVVIDAAIARARALGMCVLTLRHSHHLGRMGQYGEQVAHAGLVLLAFTNVINRAPTVAPYGGSQARLTTNPLCFAGPLPGGRPPLVVDMATSAIPVNKARVLAAQGLPAPEGTMIDAHGRPTTNAADLFANPPGALLPFGGHKGYALGLVTELLAGVLSGGGTIQPEHPRGNAATNNLFAVVLDPKALCGEDWGTHEVDAFLQYLQDCPPQPGVDRVQYPGEFEAANRARHATHVSYEPGIWAGLAELARILDVPIPG